MPKLRELHIGRVDKNACEAASSLNFLYCDTFELIGRREERRMRVTRRNARVGGVGAREPRVLLRENAPTARYAVSRRIDGF